MKKLIKFPDFFIVGAQKCGTSTVHNWLNQDSRINLPTYKETHFFSTHYSKGMNWYLKQFPDFYNGKYILRGEVDPSYMFFPKVFERIKRDTDNPKFIFIFRRPIDRSYSHYIMSKFRGYELLSFSDAINAENQRLKDKDIFSFTHFSYLKRSKYSEQLDTFFKFFDTCNCMYVKFDDLFDADNKKRIIEEIYSFLNVNFKNDIDLSVKKNVASIPKSNFLNKILYSSKIFEKLNLSRRWGYKIKSFIQYYNKNAIDEELLKDEKIKIFNNLSDDVLEWNNEEVRKIMKIIKIDLNDWII